ncbi:HMG box domain-containing protein [Mycena indigotica]|uniref:HMG box domain-containing protein n=1 Tax=Mycena indigotica TaxID=2126181 RepID=A0A8H6WEZ3_9AGAR|nr:HMG box domain-containing protein [Mycena indigotica]KAF7315317.1 HMG box domain-containing protein [Mycena indigotica]
MSKVYVGNLSWNTTDESLRAAFSEFGQVLDCIVMRDRETGRSRGFGFVTYGSSQEADTAIGSLNEQELDGRRIRVNLANARGSGGGAGGYSGGGGGGGYQSQGGGAGYGGYSGGGGQLAMVKAPQAMARVARLAVGTIKEATIKVEATGKVATLARGEELIQVTNFVTLSSTLSLLAVVYIDQRDCNGHASITLSSPPSVSRPTTPALFSAVGPMAGPARNAKTVQPPRPPNAWILYRAEKAKEIGRKAQADVSREISTMWKNEAPHIRAEYERRADIKKAEHQAMYPEYRFQPVKREEKERLRLEKRQEKERKKQAQRQTRVSIQQPPPISQQLPPPPPLYFTADNRFAMAGPSPPLSAAASPEAKVVELPRIESYPQTPSSTLPSPALPPSLYVPMPTPEPEQKNWSMPSDYVEFDIPTPFESTQSWTGTLSSEFDVEAMLSSTANPSVFQLSGFDPQTLLENPNGNLEISLAPFDMSYMNEPVPSLSDLGLFATPQDEASDELSSFLASLSTPQPDYGAADQFLNLDHDDPPDTQPQPQQPTHIPYIPPSGASQSNNRRVGGTWSRPSPPLTSPIDPRGPLWSVHA